VRARAYLRFCEVYRLALIPAPRETVTDLRVFAEAARIADEDDARRLAAQRA
jgi:hypothetical protein